METSREHLRYNSKLRFSDKIQLGEIFREIRNCRPRDIFLPGSTEYIHVHTDSFPFSRFEEIFCAENVELYRKTQLIMELQWRFSFSDAEGVFYDKNTDTELKRCILANMSGISDTEADEMFEKEEYMNDVYRKFIAQKIHWKTAPEESEKIPATEENILALLSRTTEQKKHGKLPFMTGEFMVFREETPFRRMGKNPISFIRGLRNMKKASFREIESILADANIDMEIRQEIVSHLLEEIPFNEIEDTLPHIYDTRIQETVVAKIQNGIPFKTLEKTLKDGRMDLDIRAEIAKKTSSDTSVSEIVDFLSWIPEYQIRIFAQALLPAIDMQDFNVVEPFFADNIDLDIRWEIAKRIRQTPYKILHPYIKNQNITLGIRNVLMAKSEGISEEDVADMITFIKEVPEEEKSLIQYMHFPFADIDTIFSDLEKQKNYAQEINWYQQRLLNPEGNEPIPEKRTLVLYFREWQGSFLPHAEILVPILQKYVDGYSAIWNNFEIATRWGYIQEIAWVPCANSKWAAFKAMTSIYADAIHQINGSIENTPGSFPLIWPAVYIDSERVQWLRNGKHYNLLPNNHLYYWSENAKKVRKLTGDTGLGFPEITSNELARTVIESLIYAETNILKEVWIRRTDDIVENFQDQIQSTLLPQHEPWQKHSL